VLTRARETSVGLYRDRAVRQAVAIVIGLRVLLGVLAWATMEVFPAKPGVGAWLSLQLPRTDRLWAFIEPWQRWDALWYQHIAMSWYSSRDVPFFPLYPMLMRIVGLALGGRFALSGLLISTIALIVALVLLHRLVARDLDRATADRSMLYIAIAPVALFFFAAFTESLFLALTVAAILAARHRQWWIAAVVAAGAALTRPEGVVIVAAVLVEVGIDAMQRRRSGLKPVRVQHIVALALPVVALGAFYLAYVVPVGGLTEAEVPWGVHAVAPWTGLVDSFKVAFSGTHPEEWLNIAFALALLFSIPLMARRLPWSYTAYALASVVPILFREAGATPLASVARYVLPIFPLFVLIAVAGRRPWVDRVVTVAFPLVLTFELVVFVCYYLFVG
jgi:Dolichyl-phosphate-mannose-protein mannosyltransferase